MLTNEPADRHPLYRQFAQAFLSCDKCEAGMRKFKWIDWNIGKLLAHCLSTQEVEAEFDRCLRLKSGTTALSKCMLKPVRPENLGDLAVR
jgi:hypothetical protein